VLAVSGVGGVVDDVATGSPVVSASWSGVVVLSSVLAVSGVGGVVDDVATGSPVVSASWSGVVVLSSVLVVSGVGGVVDDVAARLALSAASLPHPPARTTKARMTSRRRLIEDGVFHSLARQPLLCPGVRVGVRGGLLGHFSFRA